MVVQVRLGGTAIRAAHLTFPCCRPRRRHTSEGMRVPVWCVQRGLLSVFRGNIAAPDALDLVGKPDLRARLADADLTAGLGRGLGWQSPRARFWSVAGTRAGISSLQKLTVRPGRWTSAWPRHCVRVCRQQVYTFLNVWRVCVRERSVISEMQTRRSTWLPRTAGLVGHPHPLRLKLPPSFSSG